MKSKNYTTIPEFRTHVCRNILHSIILFFATIRIHNNTVGVVSIYGNQLMHGYFGNVKPLLVIRSEVLELWHESV